MFWAYTFLASPTGNSDSSHHYICRTDIGPGIYDIQNGYTLIVSVATIQELAMIAGESPYALSPKDIQDYILQYYNTQ